MVASSGAVTLRQKLVEGRQEDVAVLLGCSQPWVSQLVRQKVRPSRELLERAKEVWPELDISASEEEYMGRDELAARRARELARLVLAIPNGGEIGAGYFERVRAAAMAVLEAGRG